MASTRGGRHHDDLWRRPPRPHRENFPYVFKAALRAARGPLSPAVRALPLRSRRGPAAVTATPVDTAKPRHPIEGTRGLEIFLPDCKSYDHAVEACKLPGMPGHTRVTHYGESHYGTQLAGVGNEAAFITIKCPLCNANVVGAVVAESNDQPRVQWIRCTGCDRGVVANEGALSPSPKIGEEVTGLPADVADAYDEARRTAGAAAYTACELICRKILMHIAVDKGDSEGKGFVEYLDFLKNTGYLTPAMLPWADLIRTHGNQSTHRLQAASKDRALNTLAFTAQLLRLVYEMEYKAQMYVTPVPGTS